jgi:polyisoprenoid-binding protein YceI
MRWIAKLALTLVLLLAAAGVGLWWFVFRSSAPSKAALPTRAAPAGAGLTGSSGGSMEGAWQVQAGPQVFVGYRINEVFGGDALHRTAVGRTPSVTGTLRIDGTKVVAAAITADVTGLTSAQGRRDRYIKTHGLDTTKFPQATFTLTEPIEVPVPATVGRVVDVVAHGNLTLHGMTMPVSIPLKARWNGTTIDVTGQLPIVLADWHIVRPDIAGLVSVEDHGVLEFQLTFSRA